MTTKILALADGLGNLVRFVLMPGQRGEITGAEKAGIGWPPAADLTDDILEDRLFAKAGFKPGQRRRSEPEWAGLAREFKRPGVNLMVLWEEYRAAQPDGYGYSRFCELFRVFEQH